MKKILHYFIAIVWLINGLLCKVLNLVPRHEAIVGRILGVEYAHALTIAIGVSEILMFIWIMSTIKPKLCAIVQMVVVALMNILEFALVPGLLMFGKLNITVAFIFIVLIYLEAFIFSSLKPASPEIIK